ncbi:MAG: T9SS type A sorting domain-containing protein [Bacteroidales bacterium]
MLIDNWGGCLSSAIKIIENEYALTVFPNPASSVLNVRLNGTKNLHNGELALFNMLGVQVFSRANLSGRSFQFQTDLSSGIYHYQLSAEKEILGKGKIIIK